jgi:hypothetical protein
MNFNESISLLLSFSIGGFPLFTIKKFLQGIVNKFLSKETKVKLDEEIEEVDFKDLDGLHYIHAKRLQEENILCNCNLAFCDPILLYMRTNLEWKVILDLIDQSILHIYVHENLPKLRKVGIRGAIEAANLYSEYDENKDEYSLATINYIASILKIDKDCTLYLLKTIFDDIHLQNVWDLWEKTVSNNETPEKEAPLSES